jgi:hypothetical protein
MSSNQRFLFVNKTARSKNLTRSEGRERLEILSHVQRDSSATAVDPGQGVLKLPKPSVWDANDATDGLSKNAGSIPARSRDTQRSAHSERAGLLHPSSARLSPLVALVVMDFDPFKTTAEPIDQSMRLLLTFCK